MRMIAIFGLYLIFLVTLTLAQTPPSSQVSIVVVNFSGSIAYQNLDFQKKLPVQSGQILRATDVIYPDSNATLRVICPDGLTYDFLSSVLSAGQAIPCPSVAPIMGTSGMTYLRVQRGGKQDVTIPYLISPRSTLIRTPQVTLIWNAPLNIEHFTLMVRAAGNVVWTSDPLLPADVVTEDIAQIELPVLLEPGTAYTVEICVLFKDLRSGCTTDPGWSTGGDMAFYYVPPSDELQTALQAVEDAVELKPEEKLYSTALLLYQPVPVYSTTEKPMGYYAEAIALLQQLLLDYPNSSLAQSPAIYNLLGELYYRTNLPLSAARAYQRAVMLAMPLTEPAVIGLTGMGMTTPAGDEVEYYSEALKAYAAYLTPEAFLTKFQELCTQIGDICLDLPECNTVADAQCQAWHDEH